MCMKYICNLFQREERLLQRERELEQQYVAKVRNNCLLDLARDQRLNQGSK